MWDRVECQGLAHRGHVVAAEVGVERACEVRVRFRVRVRVRVTVALVTLTLALTLTCAAKRRKRRSSSGQSLFQPGTTAHRSSSKVA